MAPKPDSNKALFTHALRFLEEKTEVRTEHLQSEAAEHATQLLAELIPIDTTTSSNPEFAQSTLEGTQHVGDYMEAIGAKVHYSEPYEFPEGSGKMHNSMIAVFEPKDRRYLHNKAQVFSAHIDTVPALDAWDGHSPHEAQITDKAVIGRGAIDLKGPAACAAGSMKALSEVGQLDRLKRPLVLALSSCEEVGLLGAADVSKLMKQHKIVPDEIMIVEPSEGYIGTGCKGAIQEKLHFESSLPDADSAHTHAKVWDDYFAVRIKASGGHSSLQGGSPADPAFAASTTVLPLVEELRATGIPIEICAVDYGKASNIVGGELVLTIGLGGTEEQKREAQDVLVLKLNDFQTRSNALLKVVGGIGNAMQTLKNEVRGMDFGAVDVEVHRTMPDAAYTNWTKGEESNGPAEQSLRTARGVYAINKDQKKLNGEGYVIDRLGATKLSVTMLHADDSKATLTYDMRYPAEAEKGTDRIPAAEDIANVIQATARRQSGNHVKVERTLEILPFTADASEERLAGHISTARNTGLLRFKTDKTHLPAGSDGNIFRREFPETPILDASAGGFAQNLHGKNEHMTHDQIARTTAFYLETIHRNCLGTERQLT